jgi:hypothetical protein
MINLSVIYLVENLEKVEANLPMSSNLDASSLVSEYSSI